MNRIEAIRIFNLVLDTVRRYEAEMGAAQSAPMNFDESRGGGVGRIGNYKPEYVAWFALCGKRALLGDTDSPARGTYMTLARELKVSRQFVSQVINNIRRSVRVERALRKSSKTFQRIAYTIFHALYVRNLSETEALEESGVSRETFRWYLDEIAVKVAPELVKYGLYTQQLRGEMVEQDLEAMGRR